MSHTYLGGGQQPRRTPAPRPEPVSLTAARYLESAGLIVLERDWCCDQGGIAVIAREGGTLVAVYVRLGIGGRYGAPLDALGEAKLTEVRALTDIWRASRTSFQPTGARVDVVGVMREGNGGFTVEHVRGVTR